MTIRFHVPARRLVVIPKDHVEAAKDFARLRVRDTYSDSLQSDPLKLERDILVGALAELAVHHFLPGCPYPDFNYYAGEKKSWQADFIYRGDYLGCKGQWESVARSHGMSWMFQWDSLTGRKDKILQNPVGLHAFCLVKDSDPSRVAIQAIVKSKDILYEGSPFLELPKAAYLQKFKRCVYFDSLKEGIEQGLIKDYSFEP